MGKATTRELLIQTLKELGPMTAAELTEATGLRRSQVDSCLIDTRRLYPKKYFIIRGWKRNYVVSGRMAPIYGYGNGPDVKPPEPDDSKARNARWREKHRAVLRVRSSQVRGSPMVENPFAQLISMSNIAGSKPKT